MAASCVKVTVIATPRDDMKFFLPKDTTVERLRELIAEKGKLKNSAAAWKLVCEGRRLGNAETLEEVQREVSQCAKRELLMRIYWTHYEGVRQETHSEEQRTVKHYKECAYDIV